MVTGLAGTITQTTTEHVAAQPVAAPRAPSREAERPQEPAAGGVLLARVGAAVVTGLVAMGLLALLIAEYALLARMLIVPWLEARRGAGW